MLEKENPELADKAKKYLGFELYYELSKDIGKPLSVDTDEFKTIMKMSEDLNEKFKREMMTHSEKFKDHIH